MTSRRRPRASRPGYGTSREDAAAEAIRTAAVTIRDLRVAEVVKQDIHLNEDGAITYRTKLQLSFNTRTSTDRGPD
jgi:flavin-binding protein dodecin